MPDQCYLAEGSCSSVGAEEATEAAGGAVLPAVGPGPDAGQGATDLSQRIRGGNVRLPEELCHVLPPSRLTLRGREDRQREKVSLKGTMTQKHKMKEDRLA